MAESRARGPHLPEGLARDQGSQPVALEEHAVSRDGSAGSV